MPRGATIYESVGSLDGLRRLADAWHHRVMEDEVVAHAFSHGYHPQHTERLAAYWAEALGGPTTYSDRYGDETAVVRRHSGNGPHGEMDQRAIACFDRALADIGIARDERLWRALHGYFAWATTTTMARYHHSADDVPDGLNIPKWSWDGLVLELTRQLLGDPDPTDPRVFMVNVLRSARELLSMPGNDFSWSSWADQSAAVEELDSLLAIVSSGALPDRLDLSALFAVTGPTQEVSLSSGWGETFLKVAERFYRAEKLLWSSSP